MLYTCTNCGKVKNASHKKKTTLCRNCVGITTYTRVILNCTSCGKARTYKASHVPKRTTGLCKHCYEDSRGKTQEVPCIDCGKIHKYKTSQIINDNYKRCKKCYLLWQRGENSPNWKGGLTPLYLLIRNSQKYIDWRNDIFKRDNYVCQFCGKHTDLNVDHYPKLFSEIIRDYSISSLEEALNCQELWNTEQNRTLCIPCHKEVHKRKEL